MLRSLTVIRNTNPSSTATATRKKCLTCNVRVETVSSTRRNTFSSMATTTKATSLSISTLGVSATHHEIRNIDGFTTAPSHPTISSSRSYSTMPCLSRYSLLPSNIINNNHDHYNSYQHNYHVRYKVFVSKYNTELNISVEQILHLLTQGGMNPNTDTRTTSTHVQIRECPFCAKPTGGKPDNQYKLYIQIGGGCYFCHRCGASGSWFDMKKQLGCFDVSHVEEEDMDMDMIPTSASITKNGALGKRGLKKSDANHNNKEDASKSKYAGVSAEIMSSMMKTSVAASTTSTVKDCLPMPSPRLAACYITHLLDKPIDETAVALEYLLEKRGLQKTTLRKYGVGLAHYNFPSNEPNGGYVQQACITFPWIMQASEVDFQESLRGARYTWGEEGTKQPLPDLSHPSGPYVTRRIKARAIANKAWQRLDPPGGGWGLFGMHTVPLEAKELVITEGEFDAMAVYQATGRPAVSLPNGCRSLPHEILPMLERFDKIYLWMDSDAPGQEGAEQFARKIGVNRCRLVRPGPTVGENGETIPPPKDANEALLQELNLEQMITAADMLPHEQILRFSDLRSHVLHEVFHPDKYVGVSVPSLPTFTGLIKGFRRGELTVLTGPTGSGKTTFLGQVSLDLAEQDINVLWGSFEIKNTRLMHKLLQQFSREPLPVGQPEKADKLHAVADRFETLPLYFMKFHGGSDIDDVLDAMDYAVYVNDVEHIILDNMQFMISREMGKGSSSFDKFDVQDIAVAKFRKFATARNVHITLVVHPRKEDEGAKLGISSIYGSAKATQEADTVLILQNDGRRKYVEVKKNRFDGTLGFAPLYFDHASGRYMEKASTGEAASGNQQLHPRIETSRFTPKKGTASGSNPWEKQFNTLPNELQ